MPDIPGSVQAYYSFAMLYRGLGRFFCTPRFAVASYKPAQECAEAYHILTSGTFEC